LDEPQDEGRGLGSPVLDCPVASRLIAAVPDNSHFEIKKAFQAEPRADQGTCQIVSITVPSTHLTIATGLSVRC
jgi:hypothetical protein